MGRVMNFFSLCSLGLHKYVLEGHCPILVTEEYKKIHISNEIHINVPILFFSDHL